MENLSRRSFLRLGHPRRRQRRRGRSCRLRSADQGSASTDLATTGNRSSEPINSSGIEVNPDEVVEVIETNIVIVGGGLSGLAAPCRPPRTVTISFFLRPKPRSAVTAKR